MIVIYGTRRFGRVDQVASEYAETLFTHIFFVPLVPISSSWIISSTGRQLPTEINLKSICAAYLRSNGLLLAALLIGIGSGWGAAMVAAASLASFRWVTRSGVHARRRAELNALAFDVRCDVALLPPQVRATFRTELESRLARSATQRAPDEVARFGATSLDEAAIAYGLLTLRALEHPGGNERELASRLLSNRREMSAIVGPYRDVPSPSLIDVPAALANRQVSARGAWCGVTSAWLAGVAIGGIPFGFHLMQPWLWSWETASLQVWEQYQRGVALVIVGVIAAVTAITFGLVWLVQTRARMPPSRQRAQSSSVAARS